MRDEIDQDLVAWLDWLDSLKTGDRVISDLDGLEYTIINTGSRDELQPIDGVHLLGSALLAMRNETKTLLMQWEVSKPEAR